LAQDRPLKLAKCRSRLYPDCTDECSACVLIDLERLGLPAAAVEGQHQFPTQTFAVGVLPNQCVQLGDHLVVPTELELDCESLLRRRQPELFKPRDLDLDARLIGNVLERLSAPKRGRG
jgi:hypothetical protein